MTDKTINVLWNAGMVIVLFTLVYMGDDNSYKRGFKNGYSEGAHDGVIRTLDTIQGIIDKQMNNDTLVSKVGFVKKTDTAKYYLSTKTLLNED